MKLIRITSATCPYCALQKEIMRRLAPRFPDLEIIDYDRDEDAAKVSGYDIHGVPFLKMGDATLTGVHTMAQTEAFLRGELSDAIIEKGIAHQHYLDNAATTPVCNQAVRAATGAMRTQYGNPSSVHYKGREARNVLEEARAIIADALGAEAAEVHFTSCGSESDNWALTEGAQLMRGKGRHIISSTVEHDAIRHTLDRLEKQGFEVTRLTPDSTGKVSVSSVEKVLRPDTILVSLMMVNNETGAVNDIAAVARLLKEKQSAALLHTDAVQAFMKIPFRADELGADMISISGHKIHAPKGIGALYVRKGVELPPLIVGGSQEGGLRAGTESVPLIAAFAAAVKAAGKGFRVHERQMRAFKTQIIGRLRNGLPELEVIESDAPHILNVSLPGARSEVLCNFMSDRGVYVSNSSACKKGARSHVLEAIGKSDAYIDGAIRISLSRLTTQEDVDALCDILIQAGKVYTEGI